MSRVSKFMENELDRVNEYLSMAKASLLVTSELCEDNCKMITSTLNPTDEKVVNYLNAELSKLDAKIMDAKSLITKFKSFYFELDNNEEEN